MVTIVFPIGNSIVRGIVVCTVAGSFATNFQLTNDLMMPVSSISGTANLWV